MAPRMDPETVEVYEGNARRYRERRGVQREHRVRAFADAVPGPRLDLGAGPGIYLPLLGAPAIALDAAATMLVEARRNAPGTPVVQADLLHLPFRSGAFDGVWASKAHQHVLADQLPMALADVQRVLTVGGRFDLTMFAGEGTEITPSDDDLPGRRFTWWQPSALTDVLVGAGFVVESTEQVGDGRNPRIEATATRARTLPDFVHADLRLLCCGLNPSLHAADAGIGYVTPGNRFWPALREAGLTEVDRDPRHLLVHDRIGMTDVVKRATPRAADLTTAEYRHGIERLTRLCAWLRPRALCLVGLAGWRAAVDRKASVGWQPGDLGGVPVYVMPSTSGLNARVPRHELADHLRRAADGPRSIPD